MKLNLILVQITLFSLLKRESLWFLILWPNDIIDIKRLKRLLRIYYIGCFLHNLHTMSVIFRVWNQSLRIPFSINSKSTLLYEYLLNTADDQWTPDDPWWKWALNIWLHIFKPFLKKTAWSGCFRQMVPKAIDALLVQSSLGDETEGISGLDKLTWNRVVE